MGGDHFGQVDAHDAGAHGEDIAVVMALGEFGAIDIGAGADAGTLHLAGGDADADAGAAQQDAPVALAGGHGLGGAVAIDGVIAAHGFVGTKVLIFQVHAVQQLHDLVLEFDGRMVAGKCNHGEASLKYYYII